MPDQVPPQLVSAIRAGECVLFLGAGATRAAGGPTGAELATFLADAFSKTDIPTGDLQAFADILVGLPDVDREEVDRRIGRALTPVEPSRAHLLLTTFCWQSIFTTNYDRLLERAYDSAFSLLGQRPGQEARVHLSARDYVFVSDRSTVGIIKLHGCIGSITKQTPLVLTTEDYRRTEKHRASMLRLLKSYARDHTILFVGYSFSDGVILGLLEDLKRASPYNTRRRMWLANPTLSKSETDLFRSQRIEPLALSFSELFEALFHNLEEEARRTCLSRRIPPVKDRSGNDVTLPARLRASLDNQLEVFRVDAYAQKNAKLFLSGATLQLGDLKNHNDIDRQQEADLERLILAELDREAYVRPAVAVLGSGGSGKSTLAARAAYNIAERREATVCRLKAEELWKNDELMAFTQRTGRCVLVVDGLELHTRYKAARELRNDLSRVRTNAVLLLSCQRAAWNDLTRTHSFPDVKVLEISERLREDEAFALVEKLCSHSLLRASTRREKAALERMIIDEYDSNLVVALLELVNGTDNFRSILFAEYAHLSARAKRVYEYVALVSQFGLSLPDYVLNEVTVKDWTVFENEVVKIEADLIIVQDAQYGSAGRLAFRTRHRVIARVVIELTVPKREDRLRMYRAVINAVGGAAEDRAFLLALLTSYEVRDDIRDATFIQEMFDRALALFPDDRDFMLQLAKFLISVRKLDEARDMLEYAHSCAPRDHFLVHQLGVCLWRQSEVVSDDLARKDLRARAVELFRLKQRLDPVSHYGFTSEVKVYLENIRYEKKVSGPWEEEWASAAADTIERGLATVRFDHRQRLEELRGALEQELGNPGAVVERMLALEKVTGLAYGSSYHLLALCLYKLNRPAEALLAMDRGLSKYPGDDRLQGMALRLFERELFRPAVRARCKNLLEIGGTGMEPVERPLFELYMAGIVATYENDIQTARNAFRQARTRYSRGAGGVRQVMANEAGIALERLGTIVEQSVSRGTWVLDVGSGERVLLEREGGWRKDGTPTNILFEMWFSFLGPRARYLREAPRRAES